MLDFNNHFARDRLRIGQRLQHVVDRTAGHAGLLERVQPVLGRLGAKARRQQGF